MTPSSPVQVFDLTVALEYGQFHLTSDPLPDAAADGRELRRPGPAGTYAVRITGRGFVRRGWPGSATPGDEWRLQLWPARDPIRPRRLRA